MGVELIFRERLVLIEVPGVNFVEGIGGRSALLSGSRYSAAANMRLALHIATDHIEVHIVLLLAVLAVAHGGITFKNIMSQLDSE